MWGKLELIFRHILIVKNNQLLKKFVNFSHFLKTFLKIVSHLPQTNFELHGRTLTQNKLA